MDVAEGGDLELGGGEEAEGALDHVDLHTHRLTREVLGDTLEIVSAMHKRATDK